MLNMLIWLGALALVMYPTYFAIVWLLSRCGVLPREWTDPSDDNHVR